MNMRSVAVAVSLTVAAALPGLSQGPLNPPGAPAPTMKSLDELDAKLRDANTKLDQADVKQTAADAKLEKRIDVLTLPGDDSATHIISQSGSYYLTGNINGGGKTAISIRVSNVTLDLNGFTVDGNGGAGAGIDAGGALVNVTVRNGTVRGWTGTGIAHGLVSKSRYEDLHITGNGAGGVAIGADSRMSDCVVADNTGGDGISAVEGRCAITGCIVSGNAGAGIVGGSIGGTPVPTKTVVISGCTVSANGSTGILGSVGSVITESTALDNAGTGIQAGSGSTISKCAAYRNRGSAGIFARGSSTVVECAASDNTSSSGVSAGIMVEEGSTVINCTAHGNTSSNGTPGPSTGMGIRADAASTVKNCTVVENKGDGISLRSNCYASGNTATGNGDLGDGAGIHVLSNAGNTRVESNNVSNNDRGIDVDGAGNLIVGNSASDNGPTNNLNYEIAVDNRYGQIVDLTATGTAAVNTNSAAGTLVVTTHPWANFAY